MKTSGVLLVDKPSGWRSRQIVDALSKATGIRKVGHAGTLDPAATGLMAILFNEGTKLSRFLMDGRKNYRATICLGVETDTYDADGETISESSLDKLTEDAVESALALFRGEIQQVPPPIAAVKVKGKPAYKYAREGNPVELKPRPVTIYSLQVLRLELPEIEIEVECSKGTYIRGIAHDLGQNLDVGGHLCAIRRVSSAPYHVRDAHEFEALLDMDQAKLIECIIPPEKALPGIPTIMATSDLAKCVANGNTIRGEMIYGHLPTNMEKGDLITIVAPSRLALTTLTQNISDLGPPPWTGTEPLQYERVLHRSV